MVPFPRLQDPNITSAQTPTYNCIAWAFGDNTRWWWPSRRAYWPMDNAFDDPMRAFESLFSHLGWERTDNLGSESEYEKIALYALNGQPTHAARLLPDGQWTSKLGQHFDIAHQLAEVEGPVYGAVHAVYRRKTAQSANA